MSRFLLPCLLGAVLLGVLPACAVIAAPSPHYSPAARRAIDTVVLHYSSAINTDPDHWDDPRAILQIYRDYRVSAHYLIDRAGTVYRLVEERNMAWHAGGSQMPAPDNRRMVNRFSIGIELVATRTSGFTDAQYTALATLVRGIKVRYPIRHLLGHDQIAGPRAVGLGLRRDVKPDPGPLFDWVRLRGMIG